MGYQKCKKCNKLRRTKSFNKNILKNICGTCRYGNINNRKVKKIRYDVDCFGKLVAQNFEIQKYISILISVLSVNIELLKRNGLYIPFNIDYNYIIELYIEQLGNCAQTKLPLGYKLCSIDKDMILTHPNNMIICVNEIAKGYVRDNIMLIHAKRYDMQTSPCLYNIKIFLRDGLVLQIPDTLRFLMLTKVTTFFPNNMIVVHQSNQKIVPDNSKIVDMEKLTREFYNAEDYPYEHSVLFVPNDEEREFMFSMSN